VSASDKPGLLSGVLMGFLRWRAQARPLSPAGE
jgi:hypothetical protein